MHFKYFSIKEIQNFILENKLAIHKKYGQNFLINAGVVDTIITNAKIKQDDIVFEIGCGLGSLTHKLIQTGASITGFEIDNAYIKHLEDNFSSFNNFTLIKGDFLKKADVVIKNKNLKGKTIIVGNLPYYITTPILDKIFTGNMHFYILIFMMQKEVAERIISREGNKTYGSLSIFCQLFSKPKIIARVSPKSFYPQPKIESCLVLFEKNKESYDIDDKDFFFKVVKSLFINRRKQLKNNLIMSPLLKLDVKIIIQALENLNISQTIRGEQLNIKQISLLSNELLKLK